MNTDRFDHRYPVTIRETHLDFFGHVNNAMYLVLYEEARWDWITRNGYGAEVIKASGFGPVILDLKVEFKRELTLREDVVIGSRLIEYSGKVGSLQQVFLSSDNLVSNTATFTFALFDLKERRIVLPSPEWKKALSPCAH